MASKRLYKVRRGFMANANAYTVEPLTYLNGDMNSFRFCVHLKKLIDAEKGFIGGSLNAIVTGVPGSITFNKEEDYKYFMKKAKETFKPIKDEDINH